MDRFKHSLLKILLLFGVLFFLPGMTKAQVSILTGVSQNKPWVGVSWSANSPGDNVTGYNVYRSTTHGSGYVLQNTHPLGNLVYRDDNTFCNITYYYVVQALNVNGVSPNSSEVSATPCSGGGGGVVTFNNTNSPTNVQATSFSGAMSVTAGGSNTTAFALIGMQSFSSTESIVSVVYGGRTMTPCGALIVSSAGFVYSQCFYLSNPPTGSNTLTVTATSGIRDIHVNLVSFNGVNQTTPVRSGTYVSNTSSASLTSAVSITSNVNDSTLSIASATGNSITGTSQTAISLDNGGFMDMGADRCTTPASNITSTWTNGAAINWATLGFSIQ